MDKMFENLYVSRELHSVLFHPVCMKYDLTPAELIVLLFLANNREYDTAKDMVHKLKIAKSHVSVSVRRLEERGYLKGCYAGQNHRTIHLQLCDAAESVVTDARCAQQQFLSVSAQGFSEKELDDFRKYLQRVTDNVNQYLQNRSSVQA